MRILILALLLLAPISAAAQERVIRQYDRFEDKTRYWTYPTVVRRGLDLAASFSFKGKGAGKDIEHFYLIFTYVGSDWRYLKDSSLYCLIDGERVDLGSARARESEVDVGYSTVQVKEWLLFTVNYQTLHRISQAKSVEIRLGDTEFHLDQYLRESLKELLGKVQVVKKK